MVAHNKAVYLRLFRQALDGRWRWRRTVGPDEGAAVGRLDSAVPEGEGAAAEIVHHILQRGHAPLQVLY